MTAGNRALVAEVVLYGIAVWMSYEMAKTPEQRRASRLWAYLTAAQVCQVIAYGFGRCGIRAELAYYQEVNS